MKNKRTYPKINAPSWKWILGICACYLSLLIASLIIELLKIDDMIIQGIILSFFACSGALIIDKNILKKLFLFPNFRDIKLTFLGLLIAVLFIFIAAITASALNIGGNVNPIFGLIDKSNIGKIIISSAIQFIGEEIMFVLPFLFIINKCTKINMKWRAFLATIFSSLLFGALHIPTYQFNIGQALVLIGIIRTGITISYIFTKNLTVSYLVHSLYDWIIIFSAFQFNLI